MDHPLRTQLLYRASLGEDVCPEVERDRIIAMFPGLDHDDTVRALQEAREARQRKNFLRSQEIIAGLIEADNQREEPNP